MKRNFFYLVLTALFVYICLPLIAPVAMGGIFAVLFFPILLRLEKWKLSTRLAAVLVTIGFSVIVLLPSVTLFYFVAKTGFQQFREFQQSGQSVSLGGGKFFEGLINLPGVHAVIERLNAWFPIGIQEMVDTAEDLARSLGIKLGELLGELVTHLPGMVIALVVVVVSTFFLLVDGRRLAHFLRRNTIFTPSQTEELMTSVSGMCRSVILAAVASGAVQATIMTIGMALTGTPNILLVGFLVFLGSFVPLIGSAPATLGVAIQQFLAGRSTVGFILLGVAVLVGTVDNFVRPLVLKGGSNLHPLLGFVAAFGGLQMIGFSGVFLGPIVAGLFVVMVRISVSSPSEK